MSGEPDPEVEMAIRITNMCRALNCLPGPGGLLDQDSYIMWLVESTLVVQNEKEQQELAKAKAQG
jgi:hypothetical protein